MTILIVDDHPIFRQSVATFLEGEEFCDAVLQAGSAEEARERFADTPPDLVLCDLTLPGESGQAFLAWVGQDHPACHRVCLTMHAELEVMRQVLATGVRGFVTKGSGYDELVHAVRGAIDGRYHLDQIMLEQLITEFARSTDTRERVPLAQQHQQQHQQHQRVDTDAAEPAESSLPSGFADHPELADLTQREREILAAMLRDQTLAEISAECNISVKTVENHRSGIYRKLGIHDRHSLFRLARRLRLVD